MNHAHSQTCRSSAGFTLIELLVAVGLLVLMLLAAGYVFSSSNQTISKTQCNAEMSINLVAFCAMLRRDIEAIEHRGYLVMGRRQLPTASQLAQNRRVYGTRRDRSDEYSQTFRNDWIEYLINSEQYSPVDPRVISQVSRVLIGHGQVADPTNSNFKEIATAWVLMRHQFIQVPKLTMDSLRVEETIEGQTDREPWYGYVISSYAARTFQWVRWIQYNPMVLVDEPTNYFSYLPSSYTRRESWGKHVLPHCAEFRIQYAMPEDLRAGAGGSVEWRDPPAVGDSANPNDPNYSASDPLHSNQKNSTGRLTFGPGDRWPALLRITVWIFDPRDRLEGGKRTTMVLNVP